MVSGETSTKFCVSRENIFQRDELVFANYKIYIYIFLNMVRKFVEIIF